MLWWYLSIITSEFQFSDSVICEWVWRTYNETVHEVNVTICYFVIDEDTVDNVMLTIVNVCMVKTMALFWL